MAINLDEWLGWVLVFFCCCLFDWLVGWFFLLLFVFGFVVVVVVGCFCGEGVGG